MSSAYVANGTYGCVMKPAKLCPDQKAQGSVPFNKISKIFSNEAAAQEEYEIQRRVVSMIDPNGEFTVRMFARCDDSYGDFVSKELAKCRNNGSSMFKDGPSHPLPSIVYEDGGVDLGRVIEGKVQSPPSFEALFWSMRYLFNGLVKLGDKGFVHLDIKPENLVYGSAGSGKVALIDFGLCTTMNAVYDASHGYVHQHLYAYYPPEFSLLSKQPVWRNVEQLMKACRITTWKKPEQVSLALRPDKIDVYSLGATLMILYHRVKRRAEYPEVLKLMAGMTSVDPDARWSAADARKHYLQILKEGFPTDCPPQKKMNAKQRCEQVK